MGKFDITCLMLGIFFLGIGFGTHIQSIAMENTTHQETKSLSANFKQCEKSLPRDQICVALVVPKIRAASQPKDLSNQ